MFVLLKQLSDIRRRAGLTRPPGGPGALQLRHVDAGSCNACESELHATANPLHDLSRHGMSITASPRHADVLLVTGPVTTRMAPALRRAYDAMSEPRIVAALGNCALGCGFFASSPDVVGRVEDVLPVDVRIPGCPPDPETIVRHLLPLLHPSAR
jgi:Ni,Fe-hydrogenase III small subunit